MNRCCCCCSLRRGSLSIATFSLVLGLAGMLYGVYEGVKGYKDGWVMVGVYGANVILAILLTYAVKRERRILVKSWVVLTTLLVLVAGGLGVYIVVMSSFLEGLAVCGVSILQLYFAIVVWVFGISLDEVIYDECE